MDDEKFAWLMIFSGIVAFQEHPGNYVSGRPRTPAECAERADAAYEAYRERFFGGEKVGGGPLDAGDRGRQPPNVPWRG